MYRQRWFGPAVLLCAAVVFAGCGQGGPRVVRVSGTVTRGGQPVPKLFLNFEPQKGRPSWGITDEAGRYSLHYDARQDGAVTGAHKVWVQVKASNPQEEADLRNGKIKLHPEVKSILQKYGQYETTPLRVEVKENNQVIDLPLD
jgi:hypothetical protein